MLEKSHQYRIKWLGQITTSELKGIDISEPTTKSIVIFYQLSKPYILFLRTISF